MVLTAYFVLSPVIGLSCHRHPRSLLRELDAGVEASGPHDFAVRISAIRQRHIRVHRISSRVRALRQNYLISTALVDVVSGVCVPPDFGMTVLLKLVGAILGFTSPTV
jgi:hypothetical protein